jgi:RNA polymerase sigma-70 factor, ECF subfamily
MSEQDLSILIERVADGDEYALAALYDATSPLVYRLVLRMLGDAPAAEEAVRDAYGRAWEHASEYSRDECAPLTWLLMIARNGALHHSRPAGRNTRDDAPSDENDGGRTTTACDPACALEVSQRSEVTFSNLDALSPDERRALELAFFSGLAVDDISEHLNQPVCEIKTHLREGLMKLREMMQARR